jgi:hypothetical protein
VCKTAVFLSVAVPPPQAVLRAAADIDQALGAWHLLAVAPVSGVGVEVEYLALEQLRAPEVSPLDIDKAELIF